MFQNSERRLKYIHVSLDKIPLIQFVGNKINLLAQNRVLKSISFYFCADFSFVVHKYCFCKTL